MYNYYNTNDLFQRYKKNKIIIILIDIMSDKNLN